MRDRVDELREALRDTGFAPDLQVRRGRFAGASDTEVSDVSALAVHHRLGGRIYARGGHHYNVVARDRVVDLCGTATTAGGPAAEVLPEMLLADERIAGLWRRLRGGLGEPDEPTEAPSRLTVVSR